MAAPWAIRRAMHQPSSGPALRVPAYQAAQLPATRYCVALATFFQL